MKIEKSRNAFSMVTAIFVIVIMATVAIFVMSLSGKIVKTTTAQYQHEQAELYAKSYTEYAILAVTGNDRYTQNCLTTINGNTADGYTVNVNIAYIGTAAGLGNCPTQVPSNVLNSNVNTAKTPLSILVDVYVDYKDPDNTAQTLTAHRRTIQKI